MSKPARPVLCVGRGTAPVLPPGPPCALSSGHLIASVSSKSLNRFRVNFQYTNAKTPMSAMPPATAIPTMEPVPRPLSSLLPLEPLLESSLLELLLDGSAAAVGVWVRVMVTASPAELVVTSSVVTGACVVLIVDEVFSGFAVVSALLGLSDVDVCEADVAVVADVVVNGLVSEVLVSSLVEEVVVVGFVDVTDVVSSSLPGKVIESWRAVFSEACTTATARRHERSREREAFIAARGSKEL